MTRTELQALILASGLNHSQFARQIGMTPRNLRRILSGEQSIGDRLAADILEMFGAAEEPHPYYPRDRWIVGEGPPPNRREYIVHTASPRFIARVVAIDEYTDEAEPDEEPADLASGSVYQANPEARLCEIQWIDPAPTDPTVLTRLMDQAADQLDWDR